MNGRKNPKSECRNSKQVRNSDFGLAVAAAVAIAGWLAAPAAAVIILPANDGDPIRGRLVAETDNSITVKVDAEEGTSATKTFLKDKIDTILRAVEAERLATLSPDNPAAYRDYAEELAEKTQDPDAAATARRLYLIAAHLAPQRLGKGAMLGLASLAADAPEARKFRAMAYLLDDGRDASLLASGAAAEAAEASSAPAPGDPSSEAVRENIRTAIIALRQGERYKAENIMRSPTVRTEFARYRRALTLKEFDAAARSTRPPDDKLLRRLLAIELALETGPGGETAPSPASKKPNFTQSLVAGALGPAPVLRLRHLIPGIDPARCVYRTGEWREP